VTRHVDPRRIATALIEEHGHEAAATHAVDRIAELHDEGDYYQLSVWREIRKAIADLAREAEHSGESNDAP
jgi:hypothetical protein